MRRMLAKLAAAAGGCAALGLAVEKLWFPLAVLPILGAQFFALLAAVGLRTAVRTVRVFVEDGRLVSLTRYAGIPFHRRTLELAELGSSVVERAPAIAVGRFGSHATGADACRLQVVWRGQRVNLTSWLEPSRFAAVERAAQEIANTTGKAVHHTRTTHAVLDTGALDFVIGLAVLVGLALVARALWP